MSFHDIRENTPISTILPSEQTSALLKEYMAATVAGIKGASLSDRSSSSNLGKDGTMLLGVVPLELIESAERNRQSNQRDQSNPSQGRTLESPASPANRSGDAVTHSSVFEQTANKLKAAKNANNARTQENSAATSSGALSAISEVIGRSVLSDASPSVVAKGALSAALGAYIQETSPKNIAPPPRPK